MTSTIKLNTNGVNLSKALLKGMKDYPQVDFKSLQFSDGFYAGLHWDQVTDLIVNWDKDYEFDIQLSPKGDEVWLMAKPEGIALFWSIIR